MKNSLQILGLLCGLTVSGMTVDSNSSIVIPQNSTLQEKYASKQLETYLNKVCGEKFQTVNENSYSGEKAIYVGATKRAKTKEFASGEFNIRTDGSDVIISGSTECGVLFGVYEFLERFAGVRFFTPECERIPEMAVIKIPDKVNISHMPAFPFRYVYYGDRMGHDNTFTRKLRESAWGEGAMSTAERYGTGDHCHTFCKYSKDFPIEISWMGGNGKRMVVSTPTAGAICYSHPEVLKRFTAQLKNNIAKDRRDSAAAGIRPPRFYSISQNDCDAACHCPQCQAFSKKHGISGLVIDFVNRLRNNIKAEYPDVYLVTFAYLDSLPVPSAGIRPADHVVVQLTTYMKKFHDHLRPISDPVNVKYRQLLNDWNRAANGNLAIWDYWHYNNSFLPPATNVLSLQEAVRNYREMGMLLVFVEYEASPKVLQSFYDLTFYTGCRLLNNPDCNVEQLISEFMDTYYGKAASAMRQYLNLLDLGLRQDKTVGEILPFWERHYLRDPEFYRQGFSLLEKAKQAVTGDITREVRINQELLLLQSAYLKTWDIHKNPLKMDKTKLQSEVEKTLPEVLNSFFSKDTLKQSNPADLTAFYAEKVNFNNKTENVSAVPLDNFKQLAPNAKVFGIKDISNNNKVIPDSDAPEGNAFSISSAMAPDQIDQVHKKPFSFGMYECTYQKYLVFGSIPHDKIPQDGKYHWFYAGTTRLYPTLSLWMHWTWTLSAGLGKYYNSASPEQEYKIYVLLKFQGPDYVKNSQQLNDVRLAKIALVKP